MPMVQGAKETNKRQSIKKQTPLNLFFLILEIATPINTDKRMKEIEYAKDITQS